MEISLTSFKPILIEITNTSYMMLYSCHTDIVWAKENGCVVLIFMSMSMSLSILPSNIFVQWNLSFTRENENSHLKTL